jgi:hypothetical protein
MIWTLYKAVAVTTVNIFLSTVFMSDSAEKSKRYRTRLNRLSRIVKRVQSGQAIHPSLLASEYGSMSDYLKAHLSADDHRYFISLQPTVTPTYVLVTKTA